MAINYYEKTFLVIDDFAEFRRSVKGLLHQLGAADIDMAANAKEAAEMCGRKRYDIILSDYNLGDGQDGQQLLEELHHSKHIRPSTVFLLVTAENSTAMVMGALEYQPDGYLTKPFNKASLQQRLDKLVEKKEATRAIDKAIETGHIDTALQLCEVEISANSKIAMHCLKTKAELLERKGMRDAAAEIYASACKERPLPWAILGYGRVLLNKGDAMSARAHFDSAVKQLPMLLQARDGLADALILLGDKPQAQQVLCEALKLSPKAVMRQSQLGDLALELNDVATATRSFRSALSQSKYSIHRSPEHFLKLANCLTHNMGGGGSEDKRLADEVQRAMQELETTYKGDKTVALRMHLQNAVTAKKLQKKAEAEQCTQKTLQALEQLQQTLPPTVALEVASRLKEMDELEKARDVLVKCAEMYGDDPKLQAQSSEILSDLQGAQQADMAVQANSEGIAHYESQRFDMAILSFRKAVALAPRNISIVLNTAQVLFDLAKRRDNSPELLQESAECLDRLRDMPPDDKRVQRYHRLLRDVNELRAKMAAKT